MRHVTGKHNEHLASASSVVLQKRAWSFSTIRDRAQFAETIHLKWRDFEPAIILCAVRWYLRYSLSWSSAGPAEELSRYVVLRRSLLERAATGYKILASTRLSSAASPLHQRT
jgi:hypothetical protein